MKCNSDIEKELGEISPAVSEIGKENVFQTPPGYFENLPEKVLALIKVNEEQTDVSANEEIKQLSPLIASLRSNPALSVPAGYFNTFPGIVLAKLAEPKEKAPVISISTGKKRKWLNYATAAAVTGVIGASALFLLNTGNSGKTIPVAQNDGIQSVSSGLPGITDADLANYLSAAPKTPEWVSENADAEFEDVAFLKIDDTTLGNMLKNIPDETLKSYEQDISGEISL